MTNYKGLGLKEEVWVKERLELLRDVGVRITIRNFFDGDFLVGKLTGGLQVAPEKEFERIATRFQTNRVIPRYREFMDIETFSSPYTQGTVLAPCNYIFSELKLTDSERIREIKRTKKQFLIDPRNNWYIYPTFKDFKNTFQSDTRASLAPRNLLESVGILEESNI